MRLSYYLLPIVVAGATIAPKYKLRTIAGIKVPDTLIINKAIEYARENMDNQTYNHVIRSWLTGQASISHLPEAIQKDVDLEVYAVSIILHDLGWSTNPDIISTDKRFEVDGANAARDLLVREGGHEWDKRRIQLVWDAIALHTTRDIGLYKEPEVWLTSLGIFTELVGPNISRSTFGPDRVAVRQDEFDAITEAFPRIGFKDYFRDVMCGLCRTKTATTYTNFVADYGVRFVEGYSVDGKRIIDMFEKNMLG